MDIISDKNAKKQLVINIFNIKVILICNITNVLLKYNWYLNLTNNKVIVDLKFLKNIENV